MATEMLQRYEPKRLVPSSTIAEAEASLDQERKALAERAANELGYSQLKVAVNEPIRKAKAEAEAVERVNRIIDALIEVDLMPFAPHAVKAYKAEALKKANKVRSAPSELWGSFIGQPNWPVVQFEWRAVPLHECSDAVPEFVLASALAIHERVPQAGLWVESLAARQVFDPFLVVTADPTPIGFPPLQRQLHPNQETFYVEVWDEPGFDGKRLI